ncbi:30S ribosomal protein S15 [Candidatus Woesearchaeota archaeon]|nr:30S ribosomal protein S15 [Candidatus Woesearchaeota archaeon]
MARMYSRKKGKAGSVRPAERKAPHWQKYSASEVEALIVKLAKEGKTPSQVGALLRDTYGVPDVKASTKKQVAAIMKEKKVEMKLPEDLTSLMRRVIALQKHMEKNRQDMTAKRGMMITESKIMKLVKYYKLNKSLPETWNYSRENVQLLLK